MASIEHRALLRRLFATDAPEPPAPEPSAAGNHVPREGHTPAPPPRDAMRDTVRELFGYDPY